MSVKKNNKKKQRTFSEKKWIDIIVICIVLVLCSFIPLIFVYVIPSITMATPLIVIFGTISLLASLTLAAVVFQYLDLSDKSEALGLPEGSIRALIALGLIVIFAIMVVFMQGELTISPLKYENGTYITDINGTIQYEPAPLDATIDFSKQVLTTVSTLVVAVAGFYFGTRSVQVAQGVNEIPMLLINPSGSRNMKKGDPPLMIAMETYPENEKVNCTVDNPEKGSVILEGNQFKFTLTNANPGDVIKLTFTLAKFSDVAKTLDISILPEENVPE